MLRTTYSHLNTVQKGSFAEAFAKMAFTLEGFAVYDTEYDDRGIDFVTRGNGGRFFSVQVKATDMTSNPFIYQSKFVKADDFIFCAVRLSEGHAPSLYLARGSDWDLGHRCLNFNPGGGAAGPYFEMRFSARYATELVAFEFQSYINRIRE